VSVYSLGSLHPILPETGRYWIAPGAVVLGNVILGEDASIWFGAVLRGDNEPMRIGARTNIQDGSVLHSDPGSPLTIGEGCTIGHRAIIHGCTVADNVLIGMGATVLNGAVIGPDSLVGANALVTEGKVFPPRSLIIGSPAKAVRELDDAALERIRHAARHYVGNAKRFAEELVPKQG
jgi:carbonic anhydrase/acetyltransferase-like protein (isoleucine patch superfamily)